MTRSVAVLRFAVLVSVAAIIGLVSLTVAASRTWAVAITPGAAEAAGFDYDGTTWPPQSPAILNPSHIYAYDVASNLARAGDAFSESSLAAKAGGSLVGRSYGRVGTVVENPGIRITGFRGARDPAHALNQVINRGVSPRVLRDAVRNPRVVLQQSGDRYLFLSDEAGVAIRSDGQVVTAYTSSQFKPHILQVLRDAGASP